jgi:hypothetical protein
MDWTPERDERLTALWNQPDPVLSIRLIGSMMDTTHNAVVGRARRLKLPGRGSPLKAPNPNKPPKRAGKVTLPGSAGIIVQTQTVAVNTLTHEVASFADWTNTGRIAKRDRLPIPVGPYGPARECQWIEGDGKPWHMCGAQSQEGYSWCPEHKARAFFSRAVMA